MTQTKTTSSWDSGADLDTPAEQTLRTVSIAKMCEDPPEGLCEKDILYPEKNLDSQGEL